MGIRCGIHVGRWKSGANPLHSSQALRLCLNLAGAFCKWLFIKARTKQECGSLPVPTGKEQTACSTGLKPGGVGAKVHCFA